MQKKWQQLRTDRFEQLRKLAEQNAATDLSEAEAAASVEQVREEVYQLKQAKPTASNAK